MPLHEELKKDRPFDDPREEAYLNLQRTNQLLGDAYARLFNEHDLSEPLYNVLKILQRSDARGLRCGAIVERMVSRGPDVTRLTDRLVDRGLVSRTRDRRDRRVVLVGLTDAAETLLEELDPKVMALHGELLGHLTRGELLFFNELLEKARSAVAEAGR